MATREIDGWTWESSIGLWWGIGPQSKREQVARPFMTSPWWVVSSEYEKALPPEPGVGPGDGTYVRIFPSSRQAMEFVAQAAEVSL